MGKGAPEPPVRRISEGPRTLLKMEIIIKKKQERLFVPWNKSQIARGRVSRENRQEYDNEKRAKELNRKMPDSCNEYNAVAIAKMMSIDEHKARRLISSKSRGIILDGKID